ncbi:MAG: hypothetical protein HGA55_02815 [Methanoregulaceae archaeon]|jgi:hypothetical protein|nr:hypothetical protein [Methanoregulaceae archaeon]
MTEEEGQHPDRPSLTRVIAAVLLGFFGGFFLFLIVALVIGAVNNALGMQIPIDLLVAENIYSLGILVLIEILCIGGALWLVWKTPPSEPEFPTDLANPPT